MNREGLTRRLQSCNARFSIMAMLEGGNEGQLRGAASSPELRGFSDSHGLYCPDNRTFPPAMCRPVPAVPPPAAAPSSSQHRRAALAPLGRGRTRGTVRGHPGTPRVTPHRVRTAAPPRERPRPWLASPADGAANGVARQRGHSWKPGRVGLRFPLPPLVGTGSVAPCSAGNRCYRVIMLRGRSFVCWNSSSALHDGAFGADWNHLLSVLWQINWAFLWLRGLLTFEADFAHVPSHRRTQFNFLGFKWSLHFQKANERSICSGDSISAFTNRAY